jgi:hypothetical protein
MSPQLLLLIVALGLMLGCALTAALVAVWSAKAHHLAAIESDRIAKDAIELLEAERRYTVALETYLPDEENGGHA